MRELSRSRRECAGRLRRICGLVSFKHLSSFDDVWRVQSPLFSDASKVYKIHNLSDEEAILVEPTACAIHGMDKLNAPVGVEVLIIGAGPTGLVLAQLLKLNGASKVVIAANKGIKTDIAKSLDAGDVYIELDRDDADAQWAKIKQDYPYGFDVVVCPFNCSFFWVYHDGDVGRSNWRRKDRK